MISLKKLDQEFAICKLSHQALLRQGFEGQAAIPDWIWSSSLYSITKTTDELSLVCEQDKLIPQPGMHQEDGWKCLQVVGPLDFSLTGILSSIAQPLADNKISIFALSTYDTDYILVKKEKFTEAQTILKNNGFIVI
jgi:uncharacterized protein